MDVKHYETIFIVTPVLSEQQIKETVEKFRTLVKEGAEDLYHEEHWGLRKLAYPINKKSTGVYQLFEFKADPTFIAKLDIEMRRDERIMRFLTVNLNKYAIEFNAKRAKGMFNKKEKEEVKS